MTKLFYSSKRKISFKLTQPFKIGTSIVIVCCRMVAKKKKKGNWFGDIADFFVSVFCSLSSLLFSIILLRGQKELATPLLLYLIVFRCSKSPPYSQCLKITKKVSFFCNYGELKRSAFSSKCYLNFRAKNINYWSEN